MKLHLHTIVAFAALHQTAQAMYLRSHLRSESLLPPSQGATSAGRPALPQIDPVVPKVLRETPEGQHDLALPEVHDEEGLDD